MKHPTPSEKEIAALKEKGLTYREISDLLEVSVNTVKSHLVNFNRKTGPIALTEREMEVAKMLALGMTTKAIAATMQISYNTVKAFKRCLAMKIEVPEGRTMAYAASALLHQYQSANAGKSRARSTAERSASA